MATNTEALTNLLEAIDPKAEVPTGGTTADLINAIADAIRAKGAKRTTKSTKAAASE